MGFKLLEFLTVMFGGLGVPGIQEKMIGWLKEKGAEYPDVQDRTDALASWITGVLAEAAPNLEPSAMRDTIQGIELALDYGYVAWAYPRDVLEQLVELNSEVYRGMLLKEQFLEVYRSNTRQIEVVYAVSCRPGSPAPAVVLFPKSCGLSREFHALVQRERIKCHLHPQKRYRCLSP